MASGVTYTGGQQCRSFSAVEPLKKKTSHSKYSTQSTDHHYASMNPLCSVPACLSQVSLELAISSGKNGRRARNVELKVHHIHIS